MQYDKKNENLAPALAPIGFENSTERLKLEQNKKI